MKNPRKRLILRSAAMIILFGAWATAVDQTFIIGGLKQNLADLALSSGSPGWVTIPDDAVSGFPLIICTTVSGKRQAGEKKWVVDLAMDRNEVVSDLLVGFDNSTGDGYHVGKLGSWPDKKQTRGREPSIQLRSGEGATYWFDTARLARSERLGLAWGRRSFEPCRFPTQQLVEEPLPEVGTWMVSVVQGRVCSLSQHTIRVREPNQDETSVLEILSTEGAGLSWFPDVVLKEHELPEDLVSRLPVTTRRTVRLIQVLTAAIRSSQTGLDLIYVFADEDWAYLEPLIALVEYECLRDLGRNDSAETVYSRWKDNSALQGNFRLVDDGLGLIQRFRNVTRP